ncbi:MAG: hypothetical protein J6S14_20870 [Clostridia bacterium]|nr:hypothetical protein [Clostridia bacterium]
MRLTQPLKNYGLSCKFPEWKKNFIKLSTDDICISWHKIPVLNQVGHVISDEHCSIATGNIIEKLAAYEDIYEDPAWIARAVAQYRLVCAKSCDLCGRVEICKYAPEEGQPVRYNCPFYKDS